MRHTPGPWTVDTGERDSSQIWVQSKNGFVVCMDGSDKDLANACLIAAAPELLESLTNLVGLAEIRGPDLHEYKAALQDARAAISKASGIQEKLTPTPRINANEIA